MKRFGTMIGAALSAGAIVTGGLFAGQAVFASCASPSPVVDRVGGPERARLLAGAYHVEATWKLMDGGTRATIADRGRLTAVGDGTVTIARLDGETVTAPLSEATCIRKDGQPAQPSELRVGARTVLVQADGSALAVKSGRPVHGEREGCGLLRGAVHGDLAVAYLNGTTRTFAYDAGRIDSIEGGTISLTRRDGESVSLSYDDRTVVRENGTQESVGDLKAGEVAMFFSEDGHVDLIRCVRPTLAS